MERTKKEKKKKKKKRREDQRSRVSLQEGRSTTCQLSPKGKGGQEEGSLTRNGREKNEGARTQELGVKSLQVSI